MRNSVTAGSLLETSAALSHAPLGEWPSHVHETTVCRETPQGTVQPTFISSAELVPPIPSHGEASAWSGWARGGRKAEKKQTEKWKKKKGTRREESAPHRRHSQVYTMRTEERARAVSAPCAAQQRCAMHCEGRTFESGSAESRLQGLCPDISFRCVTRGITLTSLVCWRQISRNSN